MVNDFTLGGNNVSGNNIASGAVSGEVVTQSQFIIDGSDESFMQDVIEASMQCPIMVDFWAPWCGPCKQLGPLVEKQTNAHNGKIKLVKINMDENPMIAGQLQIRSIPAVFAFWQGQPIDAFMGALPESGIKQFIEKLLGIAGTGEPEQAMPADIENALTQITEGLKQARETDEWDIDSLDNWQAILGEIMQAMPERTDIVTLFGHLLLDRGDNDFARQLVQTTEKPENDDAITRLEKRLAMASNMEDANGDASTLSDLPDNAPSAERFTLAQQLFANGSVWQAAEQMLHIVKHDREFNDDAARKYLLEMVNSLDTTDPRISMIRRKLSALLFS
ncbi:MAG: tetratricopeptide repeat protein [Alphaproteobacteria bacterium]|nr:tetratricopeptide repeat protein [Alphaproteobacteria bacterium]